VLRGNQLVEKVNSHSFVPGMLCSRNALYLQLRLLRASVRCGARRAIGTTAPSAKLVFDNSDLDKSTTVWGQGATKVMSDLSRVISVALKLY
jgi:hypothetical protein